MPVSDIRFITDEDKASPADSDGKLQQCRGKSILKWVTLNQTALSLWVLLCGLSAARLPCSRVHSSARLLSETDSRRGWRLVVRPKTRFPATPLVTLSCQFLSSHFIFLLKWIYCRWKRSLSVFTGLRIDWWIADKTTNLYRTLFRRSCPFIDITPFYR